MTARPTPITIDDEVVSLARRYRAEAVASLVTVIRDPHALASARAQASATLLAYSDGKPTQARQITVADVSSMGSELRAQLWLALFTWYETDMPGRIKATMRAAVDEAWAKLSKPPNRFKRGKLAGAGPHIPRWPPAPGQEPPAAPIRASYSAESAPASPCPPESPPDAASPGFRGGGEVADPPHARRLAGDRPERRPDNVVVMPGVARPPSVSRITSYQDDAAPGGNGTGTIHPSVVARSAQKDPWRR